MLPYICLYLCLLDFYVEFFLPVLGPVLLFLIVFTCASLFWWVFCVFGPYTPSALFSCLVCFCALFRRWVQICLWYPWFLFPLVLFVLNLLNTAFKAYLASSKCPSYNYCHQHQHMFDIYERWQKNNLCFKDKNPDCLAGSSWHFQLPCLVLIVFL